MPLDLGAIDCHGREEAGSCTSHMAPHCVTLVRLDDPELQQVGCPFTDPRIGSELHLQPVPARLEPGIPVVQVEPNCLEGFGRRQRSGGVAGIEPVGPGRFPRRGGNGVREALTVGIAGTLVQDE